MPERCARCNCRIIDRCWCLGMRACSIAEIAGCSMNSCLDKWKKRSLGEKWVARDVIWQCAVHSKNRSLTHPELSVRGSTIHREPVNPRGSKLRQVGGCKVKKEGSSSTVSLVFFFTRGYIFFFKQRHTWKRNSMARCRWPLHMRISWVATWLTGMLGYKSVAL